MPGSYNPVHPGHVDTAQKVRDQHRLSEIWLLPITQSTTKRSLQAEFNQKVQMCKIIAMPHSQWLKVSTAYRDHGSGLIGQLQSYKRTIEDISEKNLDTDLYIVGGEDFAKRLLWAARMLHIAAAMSNVVSAGKKINWGVVINASKRLEKASDILRTPILTTGRSTLTSSSEIRQQFAAGSTPGVLPEELATYIAEHKLYKDKDPDYSLVA